MSREGISYALRNFTDGDEHPVFWGYFPAYDWLALVWPFGGLEELPFHFPQGVSTLSNRRLSLAIRSFPPEGESPPRAPDARWTKEAWTFLASRHPAGANRRTTERKNPGEAGPGAPATSSAPKTRLP
jgi:hypothetical protein